MAGIICKRTKKIKKIKKKKKLIRFGLFFKVLLSMLLFGTVVMIILRVHSKNQNNDAILRETSAVYAFDNGISVIENENKTKDSVEIDENGREIIEFEW